MKRLTKLSFVSLLLCLALLVALSGVALADSEVKSIKGKMSVTGIDDTALYVNVFPLDGSGNVLPFDLAWIPFYGVPFDITQLAGWQVVNRSVSGEIKGRLKGEWAFTYSATLDLS